MVWIISFGILKQWSIKILHNTITNSHSVVIKINTIKNSTKLYNSLKVIKSNIAPTKVKSTQATTTIIVTVLQFCFLVTEKFSLSLSILTRFFFHHSATYHLVPLLVWHSFFYKLVNRPYCDALWPTLSPAHQRLFDTISSEKSCHFYFITQLFYSLPKCIMSNRLALVPIISPWFQLAWMAANTKHLLPNSLALTSYISGINVLRTF